MMHTLSNQPGCYRVVPGVCVVAREGSTVAMVAISTYPLRVVALNLITARLLTLCVEERTCAQLACDLGLPIKRVEALCDQLRWKGLLEAGPLLPPTHWPAVSIIIPTYNRARELERCLRSLLVLNYPCLEIIVVDDGSTDETNTVLQHLLPEVQAKGIALRVVHHAKQQGVAYSRNSGAAAAHHELIAYIDSDCVASPTWLTELVPAFQDNRVAAVGGMIRAYERRSMLGRYEDVRSSLFMGLQPQRLRLEGPLTYLPTANLLIRRSTWQQLGGFAMLSYGEDVDLCRRVLLTGAYIHYLPQGTVYHDYRTTLKAFLSIRVAYGSSEATLLQRHSIEQRVLLLPPEQATFASLAISFLCTLLLAFFPARIQRRDRIGARFITSRRTSRGTGCGGSGVGPLRVPWSNSHPCSPIGHVTTGGATRRQGPQARSRLPWAAIFSILTILAALALTILGTSTRLRKVRAQRIHIAKQTIFKATLRGHLAYTYHLCRHLTRYYTLSLLLISLLIPPLLLLTFIMSGIVIGVDYIRLHPAMSLGQYWLCSLLDDCAYEVGVVKGCIKSKMWKPLLPIIKKRV